MNERTKVAILTKDSNITELFEGVQRSKSSGGNGGDMEARIAKLEAHVEHIQSDLSELKGDMKSVHRSATDAVVRLTHVEASMATKGFVVGALMAMLMAIAALIGFADQVQAFFGS